MNEKVLVFVWVFRHWVVAMPAPGVTGAQPLKTHQTAFNRPPFFYGFLHVFAAGWGIAAARRS